MTAHGDSRSAVAGAVVERYRVLHTAAVSDALDHLGLPGQVAGVRRVSGSGTIAGPAFTVRYEPLGVDGGTVGDYIDDVAPGAVVVLANAGRIDMTVWGGLLSQVASARHLRATVIDGCCRDSSTAQRLGYSVFACATWMRTGKDRVRAEALDVPVSIGGVRVRPGDLVVGDADGVLVVPSARAEDVLCVAEEIDAVERHIAEEVGGGQRLDDARRSGGYHVLQRRSMTGT